MKTTTLTALRAVYDSDPCRTPSDRETLIRCLGLADGDTPTEPPEKILTFEAAAKRLGRSKRAVHTLARRKVLRKVTFPGGQRAAGVLASDLDKLLKASASMAAGEVAT